VFHLAGGVAATLVKELATLKKIRCREQPLVGRFLAVSGEMFSLRRSRSSGSKKNRE
jgi:hypothetical protein